MWVKGRIGDVAVAFAYCWHSSCATLHCNNCSGIPTGYAPSHFLSTYELLCTHIHICTDGIVVHIGPDYESTTYYVTQIHIHQPLPFHCLAPICVCVCKWVYSCWNGVNNGKGNGSSLPCTHINVMAVECSNFIYNNKHWSVIKCKQKKIKIKKSSNFIGPFPAESRIFNTILLKS